MNIFEKLRNLYIMGGATLGLMVAGAAPAILFGYSLYHALVGQGWLQEIAALAGGSLAVTMEVVGSVSAHVAQHSPGRRRQALAVLGIYTVIGLVYMAAVELNPVIRRTGFVAYLVAPLLYLAVALLSASGEEAQATRAAKKEQRQWDWNKMQAERDHEARMKQLELQARIELAKAKAQPAQRANEEPAQPAQSQQSRHECQDCGRSFSTVQALNAHGRWCAGVASQNGRMREGN